MRYLSGAAILLAITVSCSRGNDRPVAATPTSPSAASATASITFTSGVSGPMDAVFPPRQEPLQFRNELEAKYQQMGRPATTTYVDREGEVIWTQEYIRYRVNGCDHATATQRVFAQIDSGAPGGICAAPADGLVNFPPRNQILQFRQELETKYQQMGRGLSTTFVDVEGSLVWTQEYLRYRVNACDHATASQKVFAQIDGGPVAATCYVPCSFRLTPQDVSLGYGAQSSTVEIRPDPVPCAWTAASDASWLTIPADFRMGIGFQNVPYSVTANNSRNSRTGRVRFAWSGGEATFRVDQEGIPFVAGFTMNDAFRGAPDTTECHFRSTNTPCQLTATANLPGSTYTYSWEVSYFYGIQKRHSLTTTSTNVFTFNDQCGGSGSTPEGTPMDMSILLVISDERGNTVTIQSGANGQPAMHVKLFTC
jgi:hypothetical protein